MAMKVNFDFWQDMKASLSERLAGDKGSRVKVPVILQMEATECGAASLAMVLAHYGMWIPLEKLRQECGVNRDGSKASNVLKAARRLGCEAAGYRMMADQLREEKYPLIIHWEFNHFVVLEGIKGDRVYLNDPAVGRRTVGWAEFKGSYTGIAMEIRPGENFQPMGHRYNVLKDVGSKLWQDKWAVLFVLLIGLGMLVFQLASPVMSQIFLDDILTGKHPDWMVNLMLAMTLSFVLSGILSFMRSWCLTRWQEKITLADSSSFFWHLLKLPMDFFQQRFAGEIASRASFTESIAAVLSGSAATCLLDFFTALFFLFLLYEYSPSLTVIGVSFSLVDLGVFFYLRRRMTDLSMRVQQESGKAYGNSMNGLQMIETIKANGNEADFFGKVAGYHAKVLASSQEIAFLSQSVNMIPMLMSGLNSALIMTIGGFSIMEGVMTAGIFMAFQSLMGNFQTPFNNLVGLGQELQSTEMQMQRLNDVRKYEIDRLNYQEEEPDCPFKVLKGRVELKDISFGYSRLAAPLLQNMSLTIEPGRWVALVGTSGSGKSTLGRVVTGLYEQWEGKILFDGMERERIPRRVIVNSVSSVDQEVFLMSGTVRENISMFDAAISRDDVIRAARDACIHQDIVQLNGSYEAHVDEGGRNFSGGQRQRLEIARALAGNPSFLVLDEATSALDPLTEAEIMQNIRRRGCSCLVIAHRLSTIRDCDEIIVLEQGKIVERGTHEELFGQQGAYYNLIMEQQRVAENEQSVGGE